jgi:hypothetical protein
MPNRILQMATGTHHIGSSEDHTDTSLIAKRTNGVKKKEWSAGYKHGDRNVENLKVTRAAYCRVRPIEGAPARIFD